MQDYEIERLMRPCNLFKSEQEVNDFIQVVGTDVMAYKLGLEEMLRLCEEDELFEWCSIIKKKLDNYESN